MLLQVEAKYLSSAEQAGGIQTTQDLAAYSWFSDVELRAEAEKSRALPRWVPDAEAPNCMLCKVEFGGMLSFGK